MNVEGTDSGTDKLLAQDVRELVAHVAMRASGLPGETLVGFVFSGPENLVADHGNPITYGSIDDPQGFTTRLASMVREVEGERIALIAVSQDTERANTVTKEVADALGLPRLRVVVDDKDWVLVSPLIAAGPLAELKESAVAFHSVIRGELFTVESRT